MADYLHGIEIRTNTEELRVIALPGTGVIGLVGTAPASDKTLPVGSCSVFFRKRDALDAIYPKGSTGAKGTLYASAELMYAQGSPTIVVSRAKTDSVADIATAIERLLEAESAVGYKPEIICAPGHTGTIPTVQPNPVNPVNPTPQPRNT